VRGLWREAPVVVLVDVVAGDPIGGPGLCRSAAARDHHSYIASLEEKPHVASE
jgi:hypothetical protein